MTSKILPEADEDIVVGSPSEEPSGQTESAEKSRPKPTQPNAAAPSRSSGGLFSDKKTLMYYGVFGLLLVVVLSYLLSDETPEQPETTGSFSASARINPPSQQGGDSISPDVVKQFSSVLLQQREQIETLAQQTRQLSNLVSRQQGQISQLEQKISVLSVTGSRTAVQPAVTQPKGYVNSTLINNMKINDIQPDLAWIRFNGKVYALQVGDSLSGAQVVQIDMPRRVVVTTKGLIR